MRIGFKKKKRELADPFSERAKTAGRSHGETDETDRKDGGGGGCARASAACRLRSGGTRVTGELALGDDGPAGGICRGHRGRGRVGRPPGDQDAG